MLTGTAPVKGFGAFQLSFSVLKDKKLKELCQVTIISSFDPTLVPKYFITIEMQRKHCFSVGKSIRSFIFQDIQPYVYLPHSWGERKGKEGRREF